ncbi:MAG: WYL domain-containing protein [Verrucomicrobiota bacterium]
MVKKPVTNKITEFLLRLMDVHRLISDSSPERELTTKGISIKLGMGEKMVAKIIDFLRDDLGYEVEYLPSEHRWRYNWSATRAGRVSLSNLIPVGPIAQNLSALFLAQKALLHMQGSSTENTLRELCVALSGNADDSHFSLVETKLDESLSINDGGIAKIKPEIFEGLQCAVLNGLEVAFTYTKRAAITSEVRVVRPYHLSRTDSVWYLIAYDTERKALRIFSLTRMQDLNISAKRFERPPDFSAAEFLKNTFGVFRIECEPQRVTIHFDAWAAASVREKVWHKTQTERTFEDGSIEITLNVSPTTEVERWVLGWGRHAKVMEPHSLADRVQEHAKMMLSSYATPGV